MESSNQQRCQRKKITRKIFSPSESDVYALVHFDDSGERGIIKYGDVLTERDGELELRSGKSANLLFVGNLSACRSELKSLDQSTVDVDYDENEKENDFDEEETNTTSRKQTSSTISFIQRPQQGYRTPAPRRKNNVTTDTTFSPTINRRVYQTVTIGDGNRQHQAPIRDNDGRSFEDTGDMVMDTDNSLTRLREVSENQLTALQSLKDEMAKLTKKMSRFSNVASGKNDYLSMYQDGNGHELYPNVIDYDGENLLSITGRDPADYARKVLRKLFTADELASSVLPSRFDHLYTKKPLDKDRFDILNNAIRVQYRINKLHYPNFYSKVIQKSLSDCVYNSGKRKFMKQQLAPTTRQTINNTCEITNTMMGSQAAPCVGESD